MLKAILFFSLQIAVVFLLVFLNRKYWNFRLKNSQLALLSSLFFYISVVILAFAISYYLKKELNSYDIDGNGFFSRDEWSEAQSKALEAVSKDTGRTLAPITGILFSTIYFVIIIIPLALFNKRRKPNHHINI